MKKRAKEGKSDKERHRKREKERERKYVSLHVTAKSDSKDGDDV